MSAFGDWFVKERDLLEAKLETLALALEPTLKEAALSAAKAGVSAALAQSGTAGDRFVAARDAAEAILKADGQAIGAALLQNLISSEFTVQAPVSSAQ